MTIFEFCAKNDTEIHTVWIPREQNTHADYLSRIIDIDDWAISTEFYIGSFKCSVTKIESVFCVCLLFEFINKTMHLTIIHVHKFFL